MTSRRRRIARRVADLLGDHSAGNRRRRSASSTRTPAAASCAVPPALRDTPTAISTSTAIAASLCPSGRRRIRCCCCNPARTWSMGGWLRSAAANTCAAPRRSRSRPADHDRGRHDRADRHSERCRPQAERHTGAQRQRDNSDLVSSSQNIATDATALRSRMCASRTFESMRARTSAARPEPVGDGDRECDAAGGHRVVADWNSHRR